LILCASVHGLGPSEYKTDALSSPLLTLTSLGTG
jgi:hypothetical protein